MKLNKFKCGQCEHEFYDSEANSRCDCCGVLVSLSRFPKDDTHLLEGTSAGGKDPSLLRDATGRTSDDSMTNVRK